MKRELTEDGLVYELTSDDVLAVMKENSHLWHTDMDDFHLVKKKGKMHAGNIEKFSSVEFKNLIIQFLESYSLDELISTEELENIHEGNYYSSEANIIAHAMDTVVDVAPDHSVRITYSKISPRD